jgi:hypothetical protein
MLSPGVSVSLDQLRAAAREHVEASSRRAVAEQIGISYGALHKFLNGSTPYSANLAKIQGWYSTVAAPDQLAQIEAAVGVLTSLAPPPQRTQMRKELLDTVERNIGKGDQLPSWWAKVST